MERSKKIFALLLSVLTLISMLSQPAFATGGSIVPGTVVDDSAGVVDTVPDVSSAPEADGPGQKETVSGEESAIHSQPEDTAGNVGKVEGVESISEEPAPIAPEAPEAPKSPPKLLSRTETEITVEVKEDLEYSIDGGVTWQISGIFPTSGQDKYEIISRVAAVGDIPASESGPALTVPPATKPQAPHRPRAVKIDHTSVTASSAGATADVLFSIDGGATWQSSGTFTDLEPGKEYTIVAYYPAIEDKLASDFSEPLVFTTVPMDTYMVSNEAELLSTLNEISKLPATQPRVNVRFMGSITVSDTVTLPRLRGRMQIYLDLYGFTLKCTKPDVPVVQINTRASLGSSYYLNSGLSTEVIRGGNIVAAGNGIGVRIGAGAVAALNGLTFEGCEIAVDNSGEIETLDKVSGAIRNDGYIGTISGAVSGSIYNEGTVDVITDCNASIGTESSAEGRWSGAYDESCTEGAIRNYGYIGEISNTVIGGYGPLILYNGRGATVGSLKNNRWSSHNFTYNRALALNYGTIDKIESGRYYAWYYLFLNHGVIRSITGGYYTNDKSVPLFANWGKIQDVAGGVYNPEQFNDPGWFEGEKTVTKAKAGKDGRTWVDYYAFKSMEDSAAFAYRDGYGLGRSTQNSQEEGDCYHSGDGGYRVGKLYKVAYDMSEAVCYGHYGTSVRKMYGEFIDSYIVQVKGEGTEIAPEYLYYVEGDYVRKNDPFCRFEWAHQGVFIRKVADQYLDASKLRQVTKNGIKTDKWELRTESDSMYCLAGFDISDPDLAEGSTFTMPDHDVLLTPKWQYNRPADWVLPGDSRWYRWMADNEATNIQTSTVYMELVPHQGTSSGMVLYGLDNFKVFRDYSGHTYQPVSGWEAYKDKSRPFHYEWSLDKERWFRDGEEAPIDEQVDTTKNSKNQDVYSVYIRSVANEGCYDEQVGVAAMKPAKVVEFKLYPFAAAKGGQMILGENGAVLLKGAGEVQVAVENEDGSFTPFDFKHPGSVSVSMDKHSLSDCYVRYHNDMLDFAYGQTVTLTGLPAGTKIRTRWRNLCGSGYITYGLNAQSGNQSDDSTWYFPTGLSQWSDWSELTVKVDGHTPAKAPELVKRTDVSIAVKPEPGLEYSIDGGVTWQTDGTFAGLKPGTEYEIISRTAATDTSNASEPGPALTVKTKSPEDILPAPTLLRSTDISITVAAEPGLEYSIDGGETWQIEGTFSGLIFGTEYQIIARNPSEPDDYSYPLIAKTVFPAPILESRTDTSITIKVVSGLEYSADGGKTWQIGGTFSDLEPGTEYQIISRRSAKPDDHSLPLMAKTKSVPDKPSTAPFLVSKSDTEIAIKTEPGLEYSIDGGATWQTVGTFSGLEPGADYEIISRVAATEDAIASEPGFGLQVTTKQRPTAQVVPPNVVDVTTSSITVEPVEAQEYAVRIPGEKKISQGWYSSGVFKNLSSSTEYEVLTRLEETDTFIAGEIGSEIVKAKTKPIVASSGSDTPPEIEVHTPYLFGSDGQLLPESSMTRAEAAAIFARVFPQKTGDKMLLFPDVKPNAWYYETVCQLAGGGLLSGYKDGLFRPEAPITRAEFVSLAVRFKAAEQVSAGSFSDITSSWARDSIQKAAAAGWVYGEKDGSFRPEDTITRAEAVAIINRMAGRRPDIPDGVAISPWPDLQDPKVWYYKDMMEASVRHEFSLRDDGSEDWR